MAGRGPAPKDPKLRQRTNRVSTSAQLPSEADASDFVVPDLYGRDDGVAWHPHVIEWWESVWRSPMAREFLDADMRGGLYLLAELHQLRWTATSKTALLDAAKEIRLQEVRFGMSPIDRRRLQWEVARGEDAERRRSKPKRAKGKKGSDPRDVLRLA